MLISEQISENAERHEKQLVIDLEKRVHSLMHQVRQKEAKLQELEKDQRTEQGMIVKFKEVTEQHN